MAKTTEEHAYSDEVQAEGETGAITIEAGAASGKDGSSGGSERRRTKSARAKRIDEAISQTPSIEEQPVDQKVDKRKTRRNPTARKKDLQVGRENAAIILSLLDGLAVMVLGPDAGMNDFERLMIQEPLERILSRMEWETGEAVNRWMDPIMVIIGLIGWGGRLLQVAEEKRKPSKPDDGRYGPKETQTQAPAVKPQPGPPDLGVITKAPVTIGRESEHLSVRLENM